MAKSKKSEKANQQEKTFDIVAALEVTRNEIREKGIHRFDNHFGDYSPSNRRDAMMKLACHLIEHPMDKEDTPMVGDILYEQFRLHNPIFF